MAQFLDDGLVAEAREAGKRIAAGAGGPEGAVAEVEETLRSLGLGIREWLVVARRTLRDQGGSRDLTFLLGYSDEGDGVWAVKLKASDPRRAVAGRLVRLRDCPVHVQLRLLGKLKELVGAIVARARTLADVIEQALPRICP